MRESKYDVYRDQIEQIYQENPRISIQEIGRICLNGEMPTSRFRNFIKYTIEGTPHRANPREFVETAKKYDSSGFLLSSTEKLQSKPVEIPANHEIFAISTNATTGQQWIKTRVKEIPDEEQAADNLATLKELINGYKPKHRLGSILTEREGVVILSDLHWGAYVNGLTLSQDFDTHTLINMLRKCAAETNLSGYKKVHFIFTGDLIESFTGMNHPNSWQGIQQDEFGVRAVKNLVDALVIHLFERVVNLGSIKIVAGNHDRLTSSKKEDTKGGAAEFVSWGLDLLGYDVEFSPDIISTEIDGINYIINHGHLPLTQKLSAEQICWKYGVKGMFNYIIEGHLHSRILKLSTAQQRNFKLIQDDSVDTRRQICPSFFPGNFYSESLGFSTCPGYLKVHNNGFGKPTVTDTPV